MCHQPFFFFVRSHCRCLPEPAIRWCSGDLSRGFLSFSIGFSLDFRFESQERHNGQPTQQPNEVWSHVPSRRSHFPHTTLFLGWFLGPMRSQILLFFWDTLPYLVHRLSRCKR